MFDRQTTKTTMLASTAAFFYLLAYTSAFIVPRRAFRQVIKSAVEGNSELQLQPQTFLDEVFEEAEVFISALQGSAPALIPSEGGGGGDDDGFGGINGGGGSGGGGGGSGGGESGGGNEGDERGRKSWFIVLWTLFTKYRDARPDSTMVAGSTVCVIAGFSGGMSFTNFTAARRLGMADKTVSNLTLRSHEFRHSCRLNTDCFPCFAYTQL